MTLIKFFISYNKKTLPTIAFRVFINLKMSNKSYYWIDNIMIFHLKFYYIQTYLPNKYLKNNYYSW